MGALFDLVGFSTTTTGTGTLTIGPPLPGLRPLSTAPDGTVISYSIKSASGQYETGTGTVGGGGTTLTRTLLNSTTGALLNLSGTSEVRCTPNAGDFYAPPEVATFADLPDAGSVTVGRVYTVLTPLCAGGIPGTQWRSNGAVWRPACAQVVYRNDIQIDGVTGGINAWQFLAQPQFAAGVLRYCSSVRVRTKWLFSGTETNSRTMRMFLGVNGTISDTAFTGGSGAANVRVLSASASFFATSDGTIQGPLSPLTGASSQDYMAGVNALTTSTAATAELTVPNMSTNELILSVGILQGASPTATVSIPVGGAIIYIE